MKVFVSSTCYDLVDLRAELYEELRGMGIDAHFSDLKESGFSVPSEPTTNSIEACIADMLSCDLVVFVLSQRYGPVLKGQFGDVSATRAEYDAAKKAKKPTHFYVRNDLWGDYTAWRRNGRKSDFKPSWAASFEDAAGLFAMIADHVSLHGEDGKADANNWRETFASSVDLRETLRRRLRPQAIQASAERLIEAGRTPLLLVTRMSGSGSSGLQDQPIFRFEFEVVNAGEMAAVEVNAFLSLGPDAGFPPDNNVPAILPARASSTKNIVTIDVPQRSVHQLFEKQVEQGAPLHGRLELSYFTQTGHSFSDSSEFKLRLVQNKLTPTTGIRVGGKTICTPSSAYGRKLAGLSD